MTAVTQMPGTPLERAPRSAVMHAWDWARANLFNTIPNAVVTLIIAYLLVTWIPAIVDWALISAVWSAPNDQVCRAQGGACWAFIIEWGRFLLFGRFPYTEQWRPAIVLGIFGILLLVSLKRGIRGGTLLAIWVAGIVVIFAIMWGGFLGLRYVETDLWNGLPLTLILAVGGVGFGFPIGVLGALGRRSQLPAIRWLSIVYIEVIRGVPLITFLFMASVLFPLFLPTGVSVAKLWRAEAAFALFFGAYLAEAVRGGLQAIPRGQYEAADALGLGYWRKTYLIVLPQALTISIPSIVNIFIGAVKDTTLIAIVGIFDILGDVNNAMNDPSWRHAYVEAYAFVGIVFFAFCFFMSRYSQRLERSLSRARPGPRRR